MDLRQEPFLIIDCQTTGLSHQKAELLEIGWSFSLEEADISTGLVKPTDLEGIPKKVWRMTGLSADEVQEGIAAEAIWRSLCEAARKIQPRAVVIHYAQFEMPFLRTLHHKVFGEVEFPWPVICTYRLAKKLHPELPARTLRAISGHLGFVLPEACRSQGHVTATQKVWKYLLETLAKEGVATWAEFQEWLQKPVAKAEKPSERKYLMSREARLDLPVGPGVYEMFSSTGSILYIGKATSLRDRVNSYFRQRRSTRAMLHELMTQVADIKVTETETPLEAALLENDRIKAIQPQYNDSLRTYERRLSFVAKDLSQISSISDKITCWGPFSVASPFDSLERLLRLQKEELEEADLLMLAHDPAEIKKVLETLLDELRVSYHALSLFDLLHAGRRKLPELASDDEIGGSVQRKLKRAVRQLHHARWLCWLMESRVEWEIPKDPQHRWRSLSISGGKVVASEFCALSPFKRPRASMKTRQAQMDVATYDRMRILMTELTILVKRGMNVRIHFSSYRHFSTSEVAWFVQFMTPPKSPEEELTEPPVAVDVGAAL